MPGPELYVDGQPVAQKYVNFYKGLTEFVGLEQQLNKYHFMKLETTYRKATAEEIQEWKEFQIKIRQEHPEIDQIYAQKKGLCVLQSPFFNRINPLGICETALWAVKCLRMFIKRKAADLRNHLAQQLKSRIL